MQFLQIAHERNFSIMRCLKIILCLLVVMVLINAQMIVLADFVIPADTTIIKSRAFENVPLSEVTVSLPNGLKRIESRAFAGTGITSVYIPRSVEFIASNAFEGCIDFHPTVEVGSYAREWCTENNITPYIMSGLGVAAHMQDDIRSFIAAHPSSTSGKPEFRQLPTGGSYSGDVYNYGLLTEDSLNSAINMVNQIRYIAGLNADVVNDESHEACLAAITMVNGLNGSLSHFPARPAVLANSSYDDLYELAEQGGLCSNLSAGRSNLAASVLGYMDDSDSYNIAALGHRRWILNPSMGKTTFGFYETNTGYWYYSGMYAFDSSGTGFQKPVAWPAQQTPIAYFGCNSGRNKCAWSVSFSKYIDADAVKVTLVNTQTKETWCFSSQASDGYFNVNNEGYAETGCVIFRPDGISIQAGDTYLVTVENSSNMTALRYTVTFFSLA